MPINGRPASEVLHDIVANLQDIIRSEVRLAKLEVRNEAAKTKSAVIWIGMGAGGAFFAALFLLWTTVYAFSLVMPYWTASLIVGAVLALFAAISLNSGIKRFRAIHPAPEHTVESIKENVEWAKQRSK